MPNSTPHIQQVRVESQTLPVKERVEQTSARGDIKVSPCGGIEITLNLDRPNEEVDVSAVDIRDDSADFVYKKEGGAYDKTTTYGPFPEGEEVFYVKEKNKECIFKVTKEVIHCDISLSASHEDEEYGLSNGSIEATVTTSSDSVEWRFDGGAWYSGGKTQEWNGLAAGTYLIEVRDEWGCKTSRSVTLDNVADTFAPSIPDNVTISDRSDGEAAVISWDTSTDDETSIDHYDVYRSQTSGFTLDDTTRVGSDIQNTEFEDEGVVDDTTYYYRVTATDARDNESTGSTEKQFTFTDDVAPQAPSSLSGQVSDNTVDLDWTASSTPDVDHYNIYRDYTKVSQVSSGTTSYSDTGLTNEIEYEYVVTAVDEAGNESSNSNVIKKTPIDTNPPSDPTGLTSSNYDANNQEVSLSWDKNTEDDLDHYNVYRSTQSGGPYNKIAESTDESFVNSISDSEEGTIFYYVVEAEDDDDLKSGYSNEVSVDTSPTKKYTYSETQDLKNQSWISSGDLTESEHVIEDSGDLSLIKGTDKYETGIVNVNGWTSVSIEGDFDNPVIIVSGQQGADLSFEGEASRAIIRNISGESFEINNYYAGGTEVQEDVGYIILEKGHYTIDGVEVEVGTYTTTGSMSSFSFNQSFGSGSIALVDTLQQEVGHAYSSRYDEGSITSSGFSTYWESYDESQGSNEDGGGFTAGYLAIRYDQSSPYFEGGEESQVSADPENGNWRTVSFSNSYSTSPLVLVNPVSQAGGDPAVTGIGNRSTGSVDIRPTEGDVGDSEVGHADDDITWIAINVAESEYNTDGYRISSPLSLHQVQDLDSSDISWNENEPSNTQSDIYTAVVSDPTSSNISWTKQSTQGEIETLAQGTDYTDKFLMIKEELTTSDRSSTPLLESLSARVNTFPKPDKNVGTPVLSAGLSGTKVEITVERYRWNGADEYKIYRSDTSGSGYSLIATIDDPSRIDTYKDTLPSEGTFYYVASIVRGGEEGPQSNEDSATIISPEWADNPDVTWDYSIAHPEWDNTYDGKVEALNFLIWTHVWDKNLDVSTILGNKDPVWDKRLNPSTILGNKDPVWDKELNTVTLI